MTERFNNYEAVKASSEKSERNSQEVNERVKSILDNQATEQLAKIFGLNKEQINKLTSNETNEVADAQEVNPMELELGNIFGKKEEMLNLNKAANNAEYEPKQVFSMADELAKLDEMYDVAA